MKQFSDYQSKEVFEKIRDYETVTEMWNGCVASYGEKSAIVCDGVSHTFRELEADAAAFRAYLAKAELKKGDVVCLLEPNSYDFVKAFVACVTMGLTAAILPPALDAMSTFGCCMKFGARALLAAPAMEEKLAVARAKGVKLVDVTQKAGEALPADTSLKGSDGCVIMFTGGTTGKSKGALLSHAAVMQGTVNGCYGYENVFGQRYLLVLPLFHVFGLIRNLMTSLYTGSSLFICRNNKDMFRDAALFRPTILVAVPALAEMALNLSRQFGKNMLGEDLKTIICGAAAVSPYLVRAYQEIGIALCPGYGLTESANLVSGNPDFVNRPDSVGLVYPNLETRVVEGELWLRGRNVTDGYVGDKEENDLAFEDGWFKTGDLVRFDEDGFLYITGRKKEIIVLENGENVSPAEVEARFAVSDAVQDAQVFEDLDESGRHILALEVVPRAAEMKKLGDPAKLVGQLQEINALLPPAWRVNRIVVRDSDFERTPSMKIKRYKKC